MATINTKKNSGFTLIETMAAIAILVVAISGTMTAVQGGISSFIYSKDQVIAFYLAQEGFEQIRNLRDENRLIGANWLAGIAEDADDPCSFGNACYVDPVNTALPTRCAAVGNCPFVRVSNTGFYGHNAAWNPTVFRREITLSSINATELAVTVTVDWSKGVISRQFKARENLHNWQ